MNKNNTESLGFLIQQYMRKTGADVKIKEIKLKEQWKNIAGNAVAQATESIEINSGTVTLKFRSPVVRNEIVLRKTMIINRMNEIAGEGFIKNVIVK